MASSTFEKILLKDDRIACLTPQVKYAVEKGGQNVTSQPFKAISQTNSSHVYNVTVPSLETIISREVLWQSTITLKITGTNKPTGQYLVNYGVTDALSPFPLHHLVTQMTTTINNNTVSLNVQDTLPLVLRLLDPEELAKYECMTPTTLDFLANYADAVQPMDYQLDVTTDSGNNPRPVLYNVASNTQERVPGALDPTSAANLSASLTGTRTTNFISSNNTVLSYDRNRLAGSSYYHKPRGSWKLQALYAIDAATSAKRSPVPADSTIYVTFKVTEPLIISPFVFGAPEGKQGFYGIQTMNFQMNIAPTANRAWRCANTVANKSAAALIKTATVDSFTDSQLIFTFLTPHASDLLEPRNVVPFYELPIYRTSNLVDLTPANTEIDYANGGIFRENATVTLYSSSVQLYSIPDKLVICVRKPPATLTCNDTDSYATIKGIRINWNNQAGLLSTFSPEQLYRASVQSGLANLTWDEFCGNTISVSDQASDGFSSMRNPYSGLGPKSILAGVTAGNQNITGSDPGFKYIPTTGTILVLDFATVIQLTEEYFAPGSLGQFNLQISVDVVNNQTVQRTKDQYELLVMVMNTGVFVNEKGTSSTFTGLLTKEDVIAASQQQPYTHSEIKRFVGGSFLNGLKSAMGWVSSKLPFVKGVLNNIPNQYAQTGAKVLDAMGYGKGGPGKLADRLM